MRSHKHETDKLEGGSMFGSWPPNFARKGHIIKLCLLRKSPANLKWNPAKRVPMLSGRAGPSTAWLEFRFLWSCMGSLRLPRCWAGTCCTPWFLLVLLEKRGQLSGWLGCLQRSTLQNGRWFLNGFLLKQPPRGYQLLKGPFTTTVSKTMRFLAPVFRSSDRLAGRLGVKD